MKRIIRSPITLIMALAILGLAIYSYANSSIKTPYNFLFLLAAAAISVTTVAANLVTIYQNKKENPQLQITQSGDGTNVAAEIIHTKQIGPNSTLIENQVIIQSPEPPHSAPPPPPELPPRDVLPEHALPPPGSRLPYTRNAYFTGREPDLFALAGALLYADRPAQVAVTQVMAATGLGGIGKTQLAVEFCYRYGRYFEGVHWLNCRAGDLDTEIAQCGYTMGLEPWPEKIPDQVAVTLRAWSRSQRRLLVLDNLEDPATLRQWLPQLQSCRLLLTARRPDWPDDLGLQTHPLGLLGEADCRSLLRALAKYLANFPDDQLDLISERLGRLALAIDLTGHYLNGLWENGGKALSPAEYLHELDVQEDLLQHSALLSWVKDGSPTGQETSLAATFKLSWDRLAGEDETQKLAREVFLLAGWCAPGVPIPPDLLHLASAAETDDRFALAVKTLRSLGLLESAENGFLLHPLLSAFSRTLLAGDERIPILDKINAALIDKALAASDSGLPADSFPYYPHIEAFCLQKDTKNLKLFSGLLSVYGLNLNNIALFHPARGVLQRALEIDEATYGPDHPVVARDVNNLGGVLQDLGNLPGAQACYERALRIDEAAYGPEHPAVASVVNNLGLVLQDLGNLPGAQACFERALRIDEAAYGPDDPAVATVVNNLGRVLQALGNLSGAQACHERALRIDEAAYGPDHPAVATDVNNLGLVLQDLGDLSGAQACYERALRIDEAAYGPDHPEVARDVNNLGLVLRALGDLPGAQACFKRALRIDEAAFETDHPKVAICVNNLGGVLQDLGNLPGAQACHERALRIDEAAYGPDHPAVATDVNNLGSVLHALGDLSGAQACFERALRIWSEKLPPNHPNIRIVQDNLAFLDEKE